MARQIGHTPEVAIPLTTEGQARETAPASHEWHALGTTAHLAVRDRDALAPALDAVHTVLASIDGALSRFRPDSELMRLAEAGGQWIPVSPLFEQALRVALDAAEWTGGLLDPTVGGTLSDLGYDRSFTLVSRAAPTTGVRIRPVPGWRSVELDAVHHRVRVPAGMILDFGATAKGLAADLASGAATAAAGCGVLVALGGDIAVAGDPPAKGWPITVTDHADVGAGAGSELEQTVAISSGGLATSSVRARRWQRGGDVLHHIIDPRSGRPSAGSYRTVSVTAVTCALANAAATASIILGEPALGWLERRQLPARLVTADGVVHVAAGWPTQRR